MLPDRPAGYSENISVRVRPLSSECRPHKPDSMKDLFPIIEAVLRDGTAAIGHRCRETPHIFRGLQEYPRSEQRWALDFLALCSGCDPDRARSPAPVAGYRESRR